MRHFFAAAVTAVALAMPVSIASATAFTPGNIVVSRIGNSTTSSTSVAAPVYLDEYTTTGTLVQSIKLPSLASEVTGVNKRLTLSTTLASGMLSLSTDRTLLTIAGYDADQGTTSLTSTAGINRVIGAVDVTGGYNTSAAFLLPGTTVRSVVAAAFGQYWLSSDGGSGAVGGINYVNASGTATKIGGSFLLGRVANIFNGQLYTSASAGTGGFRGLGTVGSGLPISSTSVTALTLNPTPSSSQISASWDYFFADANTLYIADDSTNSYGGLEKFIYNSGTGQWDWKYSLRDILLPDNSTTQLGLRGLTASVSSGVATFYATTTGTTTYLVSVQDTLTDTTSPAVKFSTLAAAGTNTVFRGVDFAPIPEPASLGILALGLGGFILRRRVLH